MKPKRLWVVQYGAHGSHQKFSAWRPAAAFAKYQLLAGQPVSLEITHECAPACKCEACKRKEQ